MKTFSILLSILVLSVIPTAFAQEQESQEPLVLEKLTPSGKVLVKLEWPVLYPDEIKKFKVSFYDPTTGKLLDDIKINYNIQVTQHDYPVEHYEHNLAIDGTGEFNVMFPLESQGAAKVTVEIRSEVVKGITNWIEETVEFEVNVVPEFGVITAMILAASVVPILLVSKTRLAQKF